MPTQRKLLTLDYYRDGVRQACRDGVLRDDESDDAMRGFEALVLRDQTEVAMYDARKAGDAAKAARLDRQYERQNEAFMRASELCQRVLRAYPKL